MKNILYVTKFARFRCEISNQISVQNPGEGRGGAGKETKLHMEHTYPIERWTCIFRCTKPKHSIYPLPSPFITTLTSEGKGG